MPTAATNQPGLTAPAPSSLHAQTKRCLKCGEVKPLDLFELRKERSNRPRNTCKNCRRVVKTSAQVRQIAERRRERKDEGRTERERDALALVQELLFLADRPGFTPWRGDLNALAARVRKSGKRTPDRDGDALRASLAAPLNKNGATAADLAEDTGIPEGEVQKMLDVMCDLGTVRRSPKEVPEIARGRTIWLYSLTGAEPRTRMVLP